MTLLNGVGITTLLNGQTVKQALSAANSTVSKGVYDATLLETVDADLVVGNIKLGVNIFGKVGTSPGGGTETIEKYADDTVAAGASYTPAASGIFFLTAGDPTLFGAQYYSTLATAWYYISSQAALTIAGATLIGDGTNFRIINGSAGNAEYTLMRHLLSTGTYTRERDEQLAAGATWTPATTGFFSVAVQQRIGLAAMIQQTTAGWAEATEYYVAQRPTTVLIGDGSAFRVKNFSGDTAYYHVTMRAKMTA